MLRPTNLAILSLLTAWVACAQTGRPDAAFVQNGRLDAAFDRVPFHEWFQQSEQTRVRWNAEVAPVTLSPHQRLASQIRFVIDGAEISRRLGKGRLMMFIELEDEQNRLWQDHESLNLEQPDFRIQGGNLQFLDDFFVRPGNYRGWFAIYDTATQEHSVIRRTFHAGALHGDPFAAAWNNLPAIEYLRTPSGSDSWYLPNIRSRIAISAQAAEPTTLDVILNLTPSEQLSGSNSAQSRSLAALIPSLKVLSQVNWQNVRVNISLVDLARQRIAFEQSFASNNDAKRLNWRLLRASLGSATPGMIDVQALSGQRRQADFFVTTVQKKIEATTGSRAVVILSGPVGFEHGQDMHTIEAMPEPGLRTYYIRYLPRVPFSLDELKRMDVTMRPPVRDVASLIDQLEPLLKPISPKLFDVTNPEEFRRAMAAIIADISAGSP